ncbi:uncharacterized protein LOC143894903 [Temnothorax americanus]|uniref:uncharacterized protein LOC143894903 n=1 Tax=Temnothorax americanus TaxID=1964332 RepID=UPI004068F5DD
MANATVAENNATTLVNNTSADKDVIEASPTQISRASIMKEYLKLKRKIPVKHLDIGCPSPKHISTQMEGDKSLINTAVNTLKDKSNISCNINDFACEDETFYLPAEQVANINDMDDTENKLPEKKMLLNKFNVRSKRKIITKNLNMRCKADRAKVKGSECWECKEYYNKLGLSEEQLQKQKNQISRHRYKYERPNTPPGFWDLEFSETSGTY